MKLYLVEEKYKYNSKTSWPLSSISIYFTGQNVNVGKRGRMGALNSRVP